MCGALILSGYQTPTVAPSVPFLNRTQRENKVEKIMGWNKGTITRKTKTTCGTKAERVIHPLLHFARQMSNHLLENRASWRLLGKTNAINIYVPKASSFPLALTAEHDFIWIPLVCLDQLVSAMKQVSSPPCAYQPLGGEGGKEQRGRVITARKPCCCVSTAQQYPKCCHVINIVLDPKAKQSTI